MRIGVVVLDAGGQPFSHVGRRRALLLAAELPLGGEQLPEAVAGVADDQRPHRQHEGPGRRGHVATPSLGWFRLQATNTRADRKTKVPTMTRRSTLRQVFS